MSTRTLLIALAATALTMPALAQTESPPAAQPSAMPVAAPAAAPVAAMPAPAPTAAVTVQGAEPAATQVSRDKDTLSVDFPDEDIKTILRNVADLFELNLVVPDTLTGKTSIKLRDVTWRQIFHVVLAPAGYTYIEEGNIIKVISNESLQLEPTSTDVVIINNAKAADILPTISGMVDAAVGGKILVDARSNALVITERPSRMGRIRQTIELLDKATDQVMIESKFVEVTDSDIRNIGVNWASLQGTTLSAGKLSQTFTRDRGQTYNSGNNSTNTNTSGTNHSTSNGTNNTTTLNHTETNIDVPFMQQGFERADDVAARNGPSNTSTTTGIGPPFTVDPTTGALSYANLGPSSSNIINNSVTSSTTAGTNSGTNSIFNTLAGLTETGGTSRVMSAVFSSSDFNVILSALKTQNNTKVMSNPTIVTLNNTEATLNIGQEFPVPSYTYNTERGTFEVSGFQYKPIGIILKVTPQVNAQGIIKLALEPEVSQQADSTTFGGAGGASIPIISTRKVKTQVSLKDGYTMGIGGLITDTKVNGGTSVPVLGSIPFLGRLFSSKSVNNTATNLLIFITAKTVNADGAKPEEVFDPRAIQAVNMTREDLPGYRAPKGTELFIPATPAETKK